MHGTLSERWGIWLFGLALGAAFFGAILFLEIPLLDPDEGLHASIAQEMVEQGDYVTPSFLGRTFLDKPILFFWTQACSLHLFGMNEAAIRLPGLLFGLLGAISTAILGAVFFGRRTGILAGFFHATLILPTALAQAAVHDVALVVWTNLAILFLWKSDQSRDARGGWGCCLAAGGCLGLALLTKGLIGVAFVGLSFGLFLLVERRVYSWTWCRLIVALTIAALVASPWYLLMNLRNPGYAYYYFIQRHFLGYVGNRQPHGMAPWWYYLPILIGGGLPWVCYLPASVELQWSRRGASEPADQARRFAWIWLIGCLAFLTLAKSKLLTYMLPVFPAVALLSAEIWGRALAGNLSLTARRIVGGAFWSTSLIGPVMLPAAVVVISSLFTLEIPGWQWALITLVSLAGWLPIVLWCRGQLQATLISDGIYVAATFLMLLSLFLPAVARAASAKELAQHFNQLQQPIPRIVFLEHRVASFVFYLRPELRAGLSHAQFEEEDVPGLLEKGLQPGVGELIVIPESEVAIAEPRLSFQKLGCPYQRAGRFRIYDGREFQTHLGLLRQLTAPREQVAVR